MHKKVAYIGDMIKKNGPSNVDRRLLEELDVLFIQSTDYKKLFSKLQSLLSVKVIHSSNLNAMSLILFIFAILFNKKRTLSLHGLIKEEGKYRRIKFRRYFMEYILILLSNRIFVNSPLLKSQTLNNYKSIIKNDLIVIPNPIEFNKTQRFYGDESKFICIGGGREEKGVLKTCQALDDYIKETGDSVSLTVLGEFGNDTDAIKMYPFVEYLGFVDTHIVENNLKESAFFIQYSYQESFSLAVFEALKNGCKVLMSNKVGALDFLLGHKGIYIADINSLCSLKRQIKNMKIDDVKLEKFDLDELKSEQVANLYEKHWESYL
ncbi:TPA: glycosyltransferase family 4 protein [Vibrio parahaemolyticus]|nr:glycosyltransferase family 4 protein [Vibrio parahaemolyticus]HCG6735333.1 glycosyltransferase family 4 protein [Vibrio parahaemolyticus]